MLRLILLFSALSLSTHAAAIYQCESGGKVSYSDLPCESGKRLNIDTTPAGNPADARRQAAQEKKALAGLEYARSKKEVQATSQAAQRASKGMAGNEKKCALLEKRKQKAEKGLSEATGKSVEQARQRAKRAAEEYEQACTEPPNRLISR